MAANESVSTAKTPAMAPAVPAPVPATPAKPQLDENNYNLKSLKFWTIMFSVYSSIFLVALDRMIIVTAIPRITDEFDSISDIGWYGSAYMITCAIFNVLFGRLFQIYSTKWTYVVAVVIFEAGSALCGAAPSSTAFIVGRAIAGIGAAGMFSGGIMIIIPIVPLHKRPVFTSFFGMAFGISSVLGPLIGGAFTDNPHLTWRWCFYINLPFGAATILTMLFFLQIESPKREKVSTLGYIKRFDPLGLLFFIPSMICLILALQWGGTTYAWSSPKIIGLLVTFAVTLVLFIIVEVLMPETALTPTRVLLNRSVSGGLVFILLLSGGMMTAIYYISIWFQAAQGQSAIQAGIRTIPTVASLVVFGIATAIVVQKVGYYNPALLLSPILCAVGGGMLSTLTPTSGANEWIGYQILYGLGIGCGFQTATLIPQTVLSKADVPLGMGLSFFMQQLGGSIFLSVAQNVFSTRLVKNLAGVSGLDTTAIINTGATELRKVVPAGETFTVINAYSNALTRTFIVTAALSACMIIAILPVEWRSIKGKKEAAEKATATDSDQEEGKVEVTAKQKE